MIVLNDYWSNPGLGELIAAFCAISGRRSRARLLQLWEGQK
jgi:hypothetical protein